MSAWSDWTHSEQTEEDRFEYEMALRWEYRGEDEFDRDYPEAFDKEGFEDDESEL